ncbi:MAG: NAD(P)H-hydrate dehydratase [Candidatus Omnitrophica bacterium]|nr:NAD(P)H-hydrate dehydratase [Candidatus Omnitrophota bacterium]
MKIVTGQVMAEVDRISIQDRGIPSLSLMESAGRATARHFHRCCGDPSARVLILCGKGNNGGDGLVAARNLLGFGYRPRVLLTHSPEELSEDSRINFERYRCLPLSRWSVWDPEQGDEVFEGNPVVLDSLLGTGAKGEPRSPYGDLIERANDCASWCFGVDIASGINSDTGEVAGEAVGCRSTLTFGLPMVGHFRWDGIDYTGTLSVADIGFPKDVTDRVEAEAELITQEWARENLPRYTRSVHKGDRGRVLIVAGSAAMLGAAVLCSRAAIRTGAGLTTLAIPKSLNASVKGILPEVMTLPLPENDNGEFSEEALKKILSFADSMDSIGVGPGLGRSEGVRSLVRGLVAKTDLPMVVDADGLFALSDEEGRKILKGRSADTVLTPHPGEFLRLCGENLGMEDLKKESWERCRALSKELEVSILLKGPATAIGSPDGRILINRSGHPAMSQGGMGDILTGMVATFLGEGLIPQEAAGLAAYVHGRAAEWAYCETGSRTVSASEVADSLSKVFRELG